MNPSPVAIALINTYVTGLPGGWAGNTDAQVVAAANLASVANPVPQGTIFTPFTLASLAASISASSRSNLKSFAALDSLIADINANNIANCLAWWTVLAGMAVITSAEATALTATVQATELNPAWPAQVGWAQANLGRPMDIYDSQIARVIQ